MELQHFSNYLKELGVLTTFAWVSGVTAVVVLIGKLISLRKQFKLLPLEIEEKHLENDSKRLEVFGSIDRLRDQLRIELEARINYLTDQNLALTEDNRGLVQENNSLKQDINELKLALEEIEAFKRKISLVLLKAGDAYNNINNSYGDEGIDN